MTLRPGQEEYSSESRIIRSQLTVLIVDDDESLSKVLAKYLTNAGWKTDVAATAEEAIERVKAGVGDILISDIHMPGMGGIELIDKLRDIDPDIEVLITTGFSDEDMAIKALKAGAFDYFQKPFNPSDLNASLKRTTRFRDIKLENKRLRALLERTTKVDDQHSFIGNSAATTRVIKQLKQVGSSPNVTVLLTGESGVGKEVAARFIHQMSKPDDAPFIGVNCGAIAETLLEAELFGRERGAFTGADRTVPGVFEMAVGGTVLLDEISEMSYEAQSRLLRVLEDRRLRRLGGVKEITVEDVRIIAATNKDLTQHVTDGKFRQDLFYRIMVAPIAIPPLRERREDILPLTQHFLEKHRMRSGNRLTLSAAAEQALVVYNFPGNIRELRNVIERSTIFARGPVIEPQDLGIAPLAAPAAPLPPTAAVTPGNAPDAPANDDSPLPDGVTLNLTELEKQTIHKALSIYSGNHTAAAFSLGISTQSLYRKIRKYDLAKKDW